METVVVMSGLLVAFFVLLWMCERTERKHFEEEAKRFRNLYQKTKQAEFARFLLEARNKWTWRKKRNP